MNDQEFVEAIHEFLGGSLPLTIDPTQVSFSMAGIMVGDVITTGNGSRDHQYLVTEVDPNWTAQVTEITN